LGSGVAMAAAKNGRVDDSRMSVGKKMVKRCVSVLGRAFFWAGASGPASTGGIVSGRVCEHARNRCAHQYARERMVSMDLGTCVRMCRRRRRRQRARAACLLRPEHVRTPDPARAHRNVAMLLQAGGSGERRDGGVCPLVSSTHYVGDWCAHLYVLTMTAGACDGVLRFIHPAPWNPHPAHPHSLTGMLLFWPTLWWNDLLKSKGKPGEPQRNWYDRVQPQVCVRMRACVHACMRA